MQNMREVIDLVSDEESSGDDKEESSDDNMEGSSDDVEIISDDVEIISDDSEASTVINNWNGTSDVPQVTTPSNIPQVDNEVESDHRNVFIKQLVRIVKVKQEPITYGYEPVADDHNHHDQVKPDVVLCVPDIQPRIANVAATVNKEELIDVGRQGIEAVISKLGAVNSDHNDKWEAVGEPPLPLYNSTNNNYLRPENQGHREPFPQAVSEDTKLQNEEFPQEANKSKQESKVPIFCGTCGRTFFEESALRKHIKIHFVEFKEKCNLCGKRFRDKNRLSYHMLSHTGERPFRCNMCGAGFKVLYHLQYHMFSHTNERPHVCETCGKCYKQYCHLKQHKKKHSEFFIFKCPECGKIFHGAGTLKSHRYKHTGEWPFRCQICSKGFSNLKSCEIHETKHVKPEPRPVSNTTPSKSSESSSRVDAPPTELNIQSISLEYIPTATTTQTNHFIEHISI